MLVIFEKLTLFSFYDTEENAIKARRYCHRGFSYAIELLW
jgi:hypothetical protein